MALVTGASRGIGRATALLLGAEGAAVVVNHPDDAVGAREVVDEIRARGGMALDVRADVSDRRAVKAMFALAEAEVGPVDVLVNNAGVSSHMAFVDLTEAEWDRIISVNLTGVFNCCKAAVPSMVERRSGKIINIASELGLVGGHNVVHYSASKGGLIALSKALARELAPSGVNVNIVAPGPTETDLLRSFPEEYNDHSRRQIPLGRWGRPEDVAYSVAFLASEEASFYAGWVLSPNGGTVM